MNLRKSSLALFLAVYVVQSSGCGVLLYPERQGQKSGRIDPAIAILDGIGLFLFVIPGLVAFAIDFHQGTIYLPGGYRSDAGQPSDLRTVKVGGPMTEENIERALGDALGQEVSLTGENVQAVRIETEQLNLLTQLAMQRAARIML